MTPAELKQARQSLGFSQQRLANELGISRKMVSFMELGDKSISKRTEKALHNICLLHQAGLLDDKR